VLSRDFLFDFENGRILHPFGPYCALPERISTWAAPTVGDPHQHSSKLPQIPGHPDRTRYGRAGAIPRRPEVWFAEVGRLFGLTLSRVCIPASRGPPPDFWAGWPVPLGSLSGPVVARRKPRYP
jgi:hypothetical protein